MHLDIEGAKIMNQIYSMSHDISYTLTVNFKLGMRQRIWYDC